MQCKLGGTRVLDKKGREREEGNKKREMERGRGRSRQKGKGRRERERIYGLPGCSPFGILHIEQLILKLDKGIHPEGYG